MTSLAFVVHSCTSVVDNYLTHNPLIKYPVTVDVKLTYVLKSVHTDLRPGSDLTAPHLSLPFKSNGACIDP